MGAWTEADERQLPAIRLAREAQREWAAVALADRLAVLGRFRRLLARRGRDFAKLVEAALGAPPAETLAAEVLPLADACRFLEREAPAILKPRRLGARGRPLWLHGATVEVTREPLGVVLVVGQANYPLFLPGVQTLQALAAGKSVLLKPVPTGGSVARLFAELPYEAGLDRRLLGVLDVSPEAARAAIAAGADKVLLTGSAQTGVQVLEQLAPRLTPAVVELSGCDAAYVRADADLDFVTRALAFSLRLRDGRTCIAPRRLFVIRERAAELEQRLAAEAERMPLIDSARAGEVSEFVRDALTRRARLRAGASFPRKAG